MKGTTKRWETVIAEIVTKPEISQIGNVTTAPLTRMELIWPPQTDSIR